MSNELKSILIPGPIVGATEIFFKYWPLTVDGFDLINIVGLDNEPILISNYGEGNKPIIDGNNRDSLQDSQDK